MQARSTKFADESGFAQGHSTWKVINCEASLASIHCVEFNLDPDKDEVQPCLVLIDGNYTYGFMRHSDCLISVSPSVIYSQMCTSFPSRKAQIHMTIFSL